MTKTSKKGRTKLAEALDAARDKHARLLKKVEATQAKLEKRTRKLRTLEVQLAKLEQHSHVDRIASRNAPAQNDRQLRPARLIYNPKSGGNSKRDQTLEKIVESLRTHGIGAKVDVKTSSRDARVFAKAAVANKEKLVIVAGGDSTVEEVASALRGTNTVLGIIPVGTMNNVARSVGVPLEIEAACALLVTENIRRIDVGHVITEEKGAADYFLETAGLGLIAIAFLAGKAAQKGPLAGLPRALQKFFDHKPDAVEIELDDGQTVLANAQLITASNAPLMGLNFLIAPQAKMDDGLLDIAVYDGMGKAELIDYFVAMKNGRHTDDPHVRFYRSRKVRIRSASALAVDSDKNPLAAEDALEIEVIPQALKMFVGNGSGLNLPADAGQSARAKV